MRLFDDSYCDIVLVFTFGCGRDIGFGSTLFVGDCSFVVGRGLCGDVAGRGFVGCGLCGVDCCDDDADGRCGDGRDVGGFTLSASAGFSFLIDVDSAAAFVVADNFASTAGGI